MTWSKRGLGVVAAVLLLALAAGGIAFLRIPRVEAITVQSQPLVRTLQFSGRVATLSRVDVGSTLTGRVEQVRVREGARVRRGEWLIRLETDELRAALGQAEAAERQAAATLKAARVTLERAAQLVKQNFYSAAQLDDAQRAVDVAAAQQGSAQAAVVAAQARLEQARIDSPAEAKVLARNVEPGQIVQPGKALMTLALDGPTQLVAQVDERFLDQLRVGQAARVVADAYPSERFPARVLSIAPLVDAQRGAIEVKFNLEQQAPAFLREDMTLSLEVETGRRESARVVPLSALRSPVSEQLSTVLVIEQGHARARDVRVGLRTLAAAEILEGLNEGEAVLISSPAPAAGARVKARMVTWRPGGASATAGKAEDASAALSNAMGR